MSVSGAQSHFIFTSAVMVLSKSYLVVLYGRANLKPQSEGRSTSIMVKPGTHEQIFKSLTDFENVRDPTQ